MRGTGRGRERGSWRDGCAGGRVTAAVAGGGEGRVSVYLTVGAACRMALSSGCFSLIAFSADVNRTVSDFSLRCCAISRLRWILRSFRARVSYHRSCLFLSLPVRPSSSSSPPLSVLLLSSSSASSFSLPPLSLPAPFFSLIFTVTPPRYRRVSGVRHTA